MNISFEMAGFDSLMKKMEAAAEKAQPKIDTELIYAGFRIQRAAKKLIQSRQGIGQFVTRYRPKRQVVASGPGQPPNTDTGVLVNSIYVNTKAGEGGGTAVIVGSDLLYAKYLEHGTTKMLARPWLFPSFMATREVNMKAIARVLKMIRDEMRGKDAA